MNKWQKITVVIAFGAISICFGCTRSIDYTEGEKVEYSDLPKEVQDTLTWWGEHTIISVGDTVSVELPDVICYKSDGKVWKFSRNLNIPTQIVTIGDTIYIPSEYNLVDCTGVDSNAVFIRQILR